MTQLERLENLIRQLRTDAGADTLPPNSTAQAATDHQLRRLAYRSAEAAICAAIANLAPGAIVTPTIN